MQCADGSKEEEALFFGTKDYKKGAVKSNGTFFTGLHSRLQNQLETSRSTTNSTKNANRKR